MTSYSIEKSEDFAYTPVVAFDCLDEDIPVVDSYRILKFVDGKQIDVDFGYSLEELVLYLKDLGATEIGEMFHSLNMSKNIGIVSIYFTVEEIRE